MINRDFWGRTPPQEVDSLGNPITNLTNSDNINEDLDYLHGHCDRWCVENFKNGDKIIAFTQLWSDWGEEPLDGNDEHLIHSLLYRNEKYIDVTGEYDDIYELMDNFDEYPDDCYFYKFNTVGEFKSFLVDRLHFPVDNINERIEHITVDEESSGALYENGNELKENMNEEFVNELVPGELYHFTHNNEILYGTFKRKTPAWLFFDVEGEEVLAKPWDSVATTSEELEELIGLVDKMEKDTKVPSQVPNRFTRVPNQHNKPMGESNEVKQNYYPKLPVSLKEVERDGDNITYLIVDRNTQSLAEFTHYSNPRTSVGCIVHKVFNDNCGLWVGYETPYSPKDVLNIVHRFVSNDYFYESKSNELKQRAKKHKKKSKGMGWHMAVNAGDVEKGIEVFNNSTSLGTSSGEGTAMGEAIESNTYYYNGPIYYRGHKIAEKSDIYTTAKSLNVAIRNVLYKASQGDRDNLYQYDIVDQLVKEIPKEETPQIRPKCQMCGYEINDIGDCPVCDYGEDDLLESLSDLEALWTLKNLD